MSTEYPQRIKGGKGWLTGIISLFSIGFLVIVGGLFEILPIYWNFHARIAGSEHAQNPDAQWAVWQFFFLLIGLSVLAVGCLGLAYYSIRNWRRM